MSLAMGVTLLAGFGVGVVSTVPAFLAGGMGSLLATGVLVGGGVTKRPTQ